MPILEHVSPDNLLDQGDLLAGVALYLTANNTDSYGTSAKSKSDCCIVLSRPCVLAHKQTAVVAMVEQYKVATPADVKTFDQGLHFLTKLRDGTDSEDVFYLGQLPGSDQRRYTARLDSIHTIQVPSKPDLRTSFLVKHRIAKLQPDFRRALHTALFGNVVKVAHIRFVG